MNRTILAVTAAVLLTPAVAQATNDDHPYKEGVCHRTGNGGFVYIEPSNRSSHLTDEGEKKRGHEGDRPATAEERELRSCESAPPAPQTVVERYGCDGKLIVEGATPPTCVTVRIEKEYIQNPVYFDRVVDRVVERLVPVLGPERIVRIPGPAIRTTKRVYRDRWHRAKQCRYRVPAAKLHIAG